MKDHVPHLLIAAEVVIILAIGLCGVGLVGAHFLSNPALLQLLAAQATSMPTGTPTTTPVPRSIPTVTATVTATRDPRVLISGCTIIDMPGIYLLDTDIASDSAGDCIRIQASQVSLDCQGHWIHGIGFNGSGVAVRKYGLLNDQMPENVQVKNCRISVFHYGIYVEAGTKLSIHDNDSSHNFDDTDAGTRYGKFLGLADGGGIRLDHSTDSLIWNNTTMTQAIGIDIRTSNNITVTGNTSSNNSAWGINLAKTQNSLVSNNVIADNLRQCTWGAGVIGVGCDAGGIMLQDTVNHNMIRNNQVIGRNGNGIFIKAHGFPCGNDNSIIGNMVTGALYNSIELGFCSGNKVHDNTFRDGLDAIWLGFAHDNEIKDNIIVNMKNHGIISSNSHDNTVSGNHIENSNVGIYFSSESYKRDEFYFLAPDGDYRSHDNCLCNNVFRGNKIAIQLQDSTFNQVTGNDFTDNGQGLVMQGQKKGNNTEGNR